MRTPAPRWILVLILALVASVAASCRSGAYEDPDRFLQVVTDPDGPFVQSVSRGPATLRARYAPTDAMVLDAYRDYRAALRAARRYADPRPDSLRPQPVRDAQDAFETARARYDRSVYFYLTLAPDEGDLVYDRLRRHGFDAYGEWLRTLLFGLEEHISLRLEDGTNVPLSSYRMGRNYGVSKSRNLLLAFSSTFNGQDIRSKTVVLTVNEFGLKTGAVRFTYRLDRLSKRAHLAPRGESEM